MHECNDSFNRTLTRLVTILTKCFFPCLNPTSYLNKNCNLCFYFLYYATVKPLKCFEPQQILTKFVLTKS